MPAGAALSSETRQGRSEKRVFPRKRVSSFHTAIAPLRSHGGVWVEHSGIGCRAALLVQPMHVCCSLLCSLGPVQVRAENQVVSFLSSGIERGKRQI